MQMMLSLEFLGMTMVAACFVGWVAGNLQGAAHASAHSEAADGENLLFSMRIPDMTPGNANLEDRRAPPINRRAIGAGTAAAENARPSFAKRRRRAFFADMPSIDEVREQARQIRQTDNIWNAPDTGDRLEEFLRSADNRSVNLLSKYRNSIEELQRANDLMADDRALSRGDAAQRP